MEKKKLIKKVTHPDDKRATFIEPTSLASRHQVKIEQTLGEIESSIFNSLSKGERKELLSLLNKVSHHLDEQ